MRNSAFIKRISITFIAMVVSVLAQAQNSVGIGTTAPNANAVLHLKGNGGQGILIPTVADTLGLSFSVAENGLLVYSLASNEFFYWNSSINYWEPIAGGGNDGDWDISVDTVFNDWAHVMIGGSNPDAGSRFTVVTESGIAIDASSYGLTAENVGVYGEAASGSNFNIGVVGEAFGNATDTTVGMLGVANDIDGVGVGVRGEAHGTGNNSYVIGMSAEGMGQIGDTVFGIQAAAQGGSFNYAGNFDRGNVRISDTLEIGNSPAFPGNPFMLVDSTGSGKLVWAPAGGGADTDWQTDGLGHTFNLTDSIGIGTNNPITPLQIGNQIHFDNLVHPFNGKTYSLFTNNLKFNGSDWTFTQDDFGAFMYMGAGTVGFEVLDSAGAGTSGSNTIAQFSLNRTGADFRFNQDSAGSINMGDSNASFKFELPPSGGGKWVLPQNGPGSDGDVLAGNTDGSLYWTAASAGGTSWDINGNSGTNSSNFIGTTDAQPLYIRTNNQQRAFYGTDGSVWIGGPATISGTGGRSIGTGNTVNGNKATAIGNYVEANHLGSIVFGDWSGSVPALTQSSATDQFTARYNGGYRFFTTSDLVSSGGVYFKNGGNVGIGNSAPSEKLYVSGNTLITDTLKLPTGAAAGRVLTSDALGRAYWATPASSGVTGSGIATRVAFWNGVSSLSSNANLYWDNTNSRLGIGATTVNAFVHAKGAVAPGATLDNGVFMDVVNSGNTGYLTGFRMKSNSDATNARYSGAIFHRWLSGAPQKYQMIFALRPNDGSNVSVNDAGMTLLRESGSSVTNVGIGTTTPNAPLQFANTFPSRKIVLYEGANNDHQYYGFGISASELEYHTDQSDADHVFYSAINTTSSKELLRIEGGGRVGIGTSTPSAALDIEALGANWSGANFGRAIEVNNAQAIKWTNNGTLSFGLTQNSNGFFIMTSAADDASQPASYKMMINNIGNVNIGGTNPSEKLDVEGSAQVDGEYYYETAKVRNYSVHNSAFQKTNENVPFTLFRTSTRIYMAAQGGNIANAAQFIAPVNLPDGAVITEVMAHFFRDNTTYPCSVTLYRNKMSATGNNTDVIATVAAASSGTQEYPTVTGLTETVDNSTYGYYITFDTRENSSSSNRLLLYGIIIKYEVTKAD